MKNKLMKATILSTIGGMLFSTTAFAKTMYTNENVNLRKIPNGEIIETLEMNTKVELEKKQKKWGEVKVGNKDGYINLTYLDEYQTEKMYVIANNGLNLRTEPNSDCEIIKTVPKNTELKILTQSIKEEKDWYKGKLEDNTEYYVNKNYLSEEKQELKEENSNLNSKYLGQYKITHYCSCSLCCGWSTGITASGTQATAGRTVGCNSLPLGTKIVINGKTYTVEDRGSMNSNVIDIYCNSHSEALNNGMYYTDVYLK